MVLRLTYRQSDRKEKVIKACLSPDNSKVYIPPGWQGYSLCELLTDKGFGDFVSLKISQRRPKE